MVLWSGCSLAMLQSVLRLLWRIRKHITKLMIGLGASRIQLRQRPAIRRDMEKPRKLSLSGFFVSYLDAQKRIIGLSAWLKLPRHVVSGHGGSPGAVLDFEERFAGEAACHQHLAEARWRRGFDARGASTPTHGQPREAHGTAISPDAAGSGD